MIGKAHLAAFTAGAVLLSVGQAYAGGFALREQSAYHQGWSFAGTAAGGPGISGMFWNPALVTNADRVTFDSTYSLIMPYAKMNPDAVTPVPGSGSGDAAQDAIVPASYAATPVWGDRVYLGISINGPFGLATKPREGWAGRFDSYSSKVFTVNAAPTIGVKVNDWVSFGFGLQLQYFDVRLKNQTPAGVLIIEGDDHIGVGFTAGVQIKPWDGTEIGLGYRSSIEHDIDGTMAVGAASLAFATELNTPELVTFGIRQRVNDRLTVAGTVEWTNWSRLGTLVATGPGALIVPELEFEYNDSWFFSAGAEYQWSPEWAFRAGLGYERSPIDDDNRTTRVPDGDRLWLSAGLSYNWSEKIAIDAGYSYLHSLGDNDIDTAGFVGDTDAHAHILTVGLRYKFGADPQPVFLKDKVFE